MTIRHFDGSFSAGEITPEMFGRLDVSKYQQGLALSRNFRTLPHGPAEFRPGTEFVREVKDSTKATRLIPFSYSNEQTFAIELGSGYFRFHTLGATLLYTTPAAWSNATAYVVGDLVRSSGVNYYCRSDHTNKIPASNLQFWYVMPTDMTYEIPSPYAAADLFDIHYTQSADVMTLVHPDYPPQELRRQGASTWTLNALTFQPSITPPTSVTATATVATGSGLVAMKYVITCIDAKTQTESLSSDTVATPLATLTAITQANPGLFTTALDHGLVQGDYIRITDAGGMTPVNAGIYMVSTVPTTKTLTIGTVVIEIDSEFGTASPYLVPLDTTGFPAYTSGGTIQKTSANGDPITGAGCTNNLTTAGNYNTITWTAVDGAIRYNVYKLDNGLFGYIGQTSGLTFKDDNIVADVSHTPPMQDAIMAGPDDYPSAVCYYEQRRMFGGTNNQPQNIWGTKSGTESNFTYSLPSRDDDRLAFKIASREASAVKHLVPVTNLIALTPSTEWRISSINDALSPSSINVKAQSYIGTNNVIPVAVGTTILFSQSRGARIRELSYDWRSNGYVSSDISVLAPHLFDYTNVVDMAFSRSPYPFLWCITSHGKMLGMTYVPEQQVSAWHQHDTGDGDLFESICTISETPPGAIAAEDMVYVIVRRIINGTAKRYVERFHSRYFALPADAWFVDCGSCNFDEGTFKRIGSAIVCTVPTHGLATGQSVKLQFSDTTLNGNYTVTVIDSNTFSVGIVAAASNGIGTVAVVPSVPVTTISGLGYLEGRTVTVLADGAVMDDKVVTSGTITLEAPATKVIVGLRITGDLQTLPVAAQVDGGMAQGRPMNVNRVWLRCYRSSALKAGPDFDHLVTYKQRRTEPYGSPPALISDSVEIVLTSNWAQGGQVCVRHDDPLPLTLTSITQEVALGG